MQEFDPGLTRPASQPTLRSERRFMAEPGKVETQRPTRKNRVAPNEARELWEPQLRASKDPDEQSTIRMLIKEGIPPMIGAQIDVPPGTVTDADVAFDPHIRPIFIEARQLIGVGEIDPQRHEDLLRRINALQPPQNYTQDQKRDFEYQKQTLRSFIAEQVLGAGPRREQRDFRELTTHLIESVQNEDYDAIDDIIKFKVDIDNYTVYGGIVKTAVENIRGKDHMLEYLMEHAIDRILSLADENPLEQYPQFNLYQQTSLDSVIQTARRYDERRADSRHPPKMFKYLSDLRTKRYVMHELFRSMRDRKTYVGLVTQLLRKDGLAFVEKQIAGVPDVKMIYEEVLGSDLSFKEDWLTGQDFAEADREVRKQFTYSLEHHPDQYQKEFITPDGGRGQRSLRPWEIRRATLMGRSLYATSMRRHTYGVMGDLPKDTAILYKSVEAEYMSRILSPLKLLPQRFFDSAIARRFIDLALHQLKRKSLKKGEEEEDPRKYGYVNDRGETKGIYGKSQDSLALLDLGITEPQSNSWRGNNLFLRQKEYKTEDILGERFTIGEYLNLVHLKVEREVREEAEREKGKKFSDFEWDTFKIGEKYPYKEEIKERFNREIGEAIGRQRLFLGTLMRQHDVDDDNKTVIWKKVAELLPSRMAAFMPEETLDKIRSIYGVTSRKDAIAKWKVVRGKIWIIERARVKEDARLLKDSQQPTKTLRDYYQGEGRIINLDPQEIQLIEALQDMGRRKIEAGEFIKTVFPFTAFLEDAPETAWEELEDDDFDRQLISDHDNFSKGWGKIVSLIANPGAKPEDVIKDFNEAFDDISQPIGKNTTQKKLHPFINAYLRMARRTVAAKWAGALLELTRIPRSEMEKYNLQSKIAYDEVKTGQILDGLAQHETVSDVPDEANKEGKTQYLIMKEDNDADRKAIFLAYVRMIILILLPILGKEFFKMILPGDLAKNLGL